MRNTAEKYVDMPDLVRVIHLQNVLRYFSCNDSKEKLKSILANLPVTTFLRQPLSKCII